MCVNGTLSYIHSFIYSFIHIFISLTSPSAAQEHGGTGVCFGGIVLISWSSVFTRCLGSQTRTGCTCALSLPVKMDIPETDPISKTENVAEMRDLDEEEFAVSKSSEADALFDKVIGTIEDLIIEDDFQNLQQSFMEKYYLEFEDTEENKLVYTSIFNEYTELLEKYLEQQLIERIPGFNMKDFTCYLKQHREEVSGDIFDMLLTFTDFVAFKEMFLEYRAEREGRGLDLSAGLVVSSVKLSASTATPKVTGSDS